MRTLRLAGFLLTFASGIAVGCPLCNGTDPRFSSQHFHDQGQTVLAVPQGKGYRVVDVIKGASPAAILEEVVVRDPVVAGKSLLLVRDEAWPIWVSLGNVSARHADTLRDLAVDHPEATDAVAWQRRLEVALPHLGSRDTALADIAYSE